MTEKEIRDIELAKKINKIIYYDFKDDIKNDIFIVLDTLVNTTELKDLSATQTLIKNQYYRIQNEKEKHLEKIIQDQQSELEKKESKINSKNGTINALHDALKERTEERDRKDDIITKQNKMINLIYDFLYKFGCKFSGSFMKALSEDGFDISKCNNCEYKTCDCKDCVKQYFKNKVNSSEQN